MTGWMLKIEQKQQFFAVATAVLIAGVVQIAIQIAPLRKNSVSIRPAWDIHSQAFKKIIFLMGPMIIGLTVTQINTLADDIIAWCLSGSAEKGDFFTFFGAVIKFPLWRGSVSHLYFSQRLYQFPLGVLGIALATAIFPVMSAEAARGDLNALAKTISRGLRAVVFVSLPAMAGLFLVARPLVSVILEHGKFTPADTERTSWILLFYAIGLCGFFSQQILTRAFYSMHDSKTPMKSAIIAVGVNVVGNLTFIWFMGAAGLALSTALCSYLQVTILIMKLRKRFGDVILAGLITTFIKTVAAAAFMSLVGACVLYLCSRLPLGNRFDLIRLVIVVPISAAVYWQISRLLNITELSLFKRHAGNS